MSCFVIGLGSQLRRRGEVKAEGAASTCSRGEATENEG